MSQNVRLRLRDREVEPPPGTLRPNGERDLAPETSERHIDDDASPWAVSSAVNTCDATMGRATTRATCMASSAVARIGPTSRSAVRTVWSNGSDDLTGTLGLDAWAFELEQA